MKTYAIGSLILLPLMAAALLVAGCAGSSPPSRFYTLGSQTDAHAGAASSPSEIRDLFSIGPVDIADYLDRPQIVTRTSENRIQFSEFDRWGGSLKGEINRVLVNNLSALLATDGFMALPWRTTYRGTIISVPVSIQRLDGVPGGSLTLQARWAVLAKDTKTVEVVRESTIVLPLSGSGYDSMVHTMSEALDKLSSEIAPAVRSVLLKSAQKTAEPAAKN